MRIRSISFCAMLLSALCGGPVLGQGQDMRECNLTTTEKISLPDGAGLYYRRVGLVPEYAAEPTGPEWRQVGLYGSGLTTRPDAHELAGVTIAQQIQPINGKIVMISIGMSNTFQGFGRFGARASADPVVDADVLIVNAAQGSRPADVWTDPADATWDTVDSRLASAGATPDQVQIAWIKHAVRSPMFPPLDFPDHPETLQGMLEEIVRALKVRYPNVVLTYLSSRTRAYNSNQAAQSPEPASYEGGFAVQWMIEKQIQGDPDLRFSGVSPPAPWLSWGPYLWTDGEGAISSLPPAPFDARSDGFVWTCDDVDRDGVHPSPPTPGAGPPEGEFKVGDQLMAFFKTDSTTTPWFLASTTGGPAIVDVTANGQVVTGGGMISGAAPFSVSMAAPVTGGVVDYAWTYDDGTFSYDDSGNSSGTPYFENNPTPTKIFKTPGSYDVRVAVSDGAGNTTLEGFRVEVTGGPIGCNPEFDLQVDKATGSPVAELSWCAVPLADSFNLYRGTSADLSGLSCLAAGLAQPQASDGDPLPTGSLHVYLGTSVSAGAESSLGSSSDGQTRTNGSPCP